MTSRAEMTHRFVAEAGWSAATVAPLAGDASNRRYDRLTSPSGNRAVLMDAPPEKGEDVRPFVRIARFLASLGLSAPNILYADETRGFLLIEDLGDALYARVMQSDPGMQMPLYAAAIDVLVHLHRAPAPTLERYSAQVASGLSALAFDWYQFGATGEVDTEAKAAFQSCMQAALSPLDKVRQVLIQRDYHAENLLWLPERKGVARVGLLDFQDAMLGHPAYDLVSVLQDARRDVSQGIERAMIDYFLDQSAHDHTAFRSAYAILGAQRNLRILGVFARLCLRDGKAHYVDLIPRVWEHVQTNLQHPALKSVAGILDGALPPPTVEVQNTLKAKCATCQTR